MRYAEKPLNRPAVCELSDPSGSTANLFRIEGNVFEMGSVIGLKVMRAPAGNAELLIVCLRGGETHVVEFDYRTDHAVTTRDQLIELLWPGAFKPPKPVVEISKELQLWYDLAPLIRKCLYELDVRRGMPNLDLDDLLHKFSKEQDCKQASVSEVVAFLWSLGLIRQLPPGSRNDLELTDQGRAVLNAAREESYRVNCT